MPQQMLQRLRVLDADYGVLHAGIMNKDSDTWPWLFRGQLPCRIFMVTPITGGLAKGDEIVPNYSKGETPEAGSRAEAFANHGYTPAT